MSFLELAERCEAATGPSYELEGEIALVAHYGYERNGIERPKYTASVDAALTLVPEGYIWAVTNMDPETGLVTRSAAMLAPNADADGDPCIAATPALAICAAALRARAAMEQARG